MSPEWTLHYGREFEGGRTPDARFHFGYIFAISNTKI